MDQKLDEAKYRFLEAMQAVRDVLEGKREKPGGALCRFPYCGCNSPWEKCEKAY